MFLKRPRPTPKYGDSRRSDHGSTTAFKCQNSVPENTPCTWPIVASTDSASAKRYAPQIFNIGESLTLFVAVIIGGVASIEGSILGALFVILVPKLFADFREMVPVVYGVTILVVLIFEPLGLFGRWLKTRLYFQLWPFR